MVNSVPSEEGTDLTLLRRVTGSSVPSRDPSRVGRKSANAYADDFLPTLVTKEDFGMNENNKNTERFYQFFMPMDPPTATAQMHQVRVIHGKPAFYDPPEVEQARRKLTAFLAQHRSGHRKFKGGIRLMVKWCFPRGEHPDGAYRITRPDTDNLQSS